MKKDFLTFTQSPQFKKTITYLLMGIIALLLIQLGATFGYERAQREARFMNHFERNFVSPERIMKPHGFHFDPQQRPPLLGGGIFGEIVSISDEYLVVADRDIERTITITDMTHIRSFQEELYMNELVVGDMVVIFGDTTDDGTINAHLIRIMNEPLPLPDIYEKDN